MKKSKWAQEREARLHARARERTRRRRTKTADIEAETESFEPDIKRAIGVVTNRLSSTSPDQRHTKSVAEVAPGVAVLEMSLILSVIVMFE